MIEIRADARRAKERPVTRCDGTRRYCAAAGKWNAVFISGVTQRVAEMPPAQSLIGSAPSRALISPWNFTDARPEFPGNLSVNLNPSSEMEAADKPLGTHNSFSWRRKSRKV